MYRLAHFDDGTTQHFLVTHSVNNTTAVAARWYEFRSANNVPIAEAKYVSPTRKRVTSANWHSCVIACAELEKMS